jgi:zinc protease
MKNLPRFFTRCLFAIIFFSFTQFSFSQFKLSDKIPIDTNVIKGTLSNGLTYYIRKNTKPEGKVELRLVVNAGSVLEDSTQQGLAHFMEHMNFNGSKHFPKNELVSYLQSIGVKFGADLNAYTGFDETVYILPLPTDDPKRIDEGFTILGDWAGNALLDTSEINKERGVVLEESRLGKGAGERMSKKYLPELFNGSQYSKRLPIGIDDTIKNFKPQTLERFYKTWYRPNLEAVIVVGDIDPAVAKQEIVKHFSRFKNPDAAKPRPAIIPIPARTESKGMVLTDKEQTNTILQIYNYVEKAKPVVTWDDYRQSIVEALFNAMINQRLVEFTQQANPPFLFASTSFNPFVRGYRAFTSFAFLGNKPVKDAIDSLVATTESVKKFGFLQTELERTKSSLLNQTEMAYNNKDKTESSQLVQQYINNYLSKTPVPGIENRYEFIKQILPGITLQEVNDVAKKMESKQGKFVLLTAPENSAAQLPSNDELLAMLNNAYQLPVKAYEEKAIAKSLLDKTPKPGKIIEEKLNATLGTLDLTLSNGITITLKPTNFKNDEIQMDAWRWGGSYNYPLADKQNAENAATLVQAMGVKDMSPIELRKFLAGKTVSAQSYINQLEEGVQGNSSVKDLETFFQLIYLYFTQPRKDEQLFHSYINAQKSFLKNMKANPFAYFSDTLTKIEFNNNPWAGGLPDAEDFDKINLDTAFSIYKNIFNNAYGMHFSFVGNIDTSKIKTLLEEYLAGLPSAEKENKFTDVGLRPVKGVVNATIEKGNEPKSLVNIIFTGEAPYSREEALKLSVLAEVLNIKIIEELREQMSGIYGGGMHAGFAKRPYNNYSISVSFPCGPENVDTLTKALFKIITDAQQNGVEQKDLDKVKANLQEQNAADLKNNDHWLDVLTNSWINREDPQWIFEYSKAVDALTVADMQEAAKKYFNMQNYIKAVLLPESKPM